MGPRPPLTDTLVTIPCGCMTTSVFMWYCVVLVYVVMLSLWWAVWLSELVLEQSGAQMRGALCGRLTVSFTDCGWEWPRPAKFFPRSKKSCCRRTKAWLILSLRQDWWRLLFSALQDLLLGEICKALSGQKRGGWFAVNCSAEVLLCLSQAGGSSEPQGYLA